MQLSLPGVLFIVFLVAATADALVIAYRERDEWRRVAERGATAGALMLAYRERDAARVEAAELRAEVEAWKAGARRRRAAAGLAGGVAP